MIFGEGVSVPDEVTETVWLSPRLGAFGTVGGLIPNGFESYVAIDHAQEEDSAPYEAPPQLVADLAAIVERHTDTPMDASFAIWVGYGWTSTRSLVSTKATWRERRRIRKADDARSVEVREGLGLVPRFTLPGREYYLLQGPVSAAARIRRPHRPGCQPPDLWWSGDRRWFIATDTDLSWSYVGGSHDLTDEVAERFPRTRTVDLDLPNAAAWE
jgi:hypothetical protein